MFRLAARRVLPGALLVAVLAGCGAPPQPLPTAPPAPRESTGLGASGVPVPPGAAPSGGLPSGGLPSGYPGGVLPPGGVPTVPAPRYPASTATRPTRSPSPTRSTPPPAPLCRSGPSKQQVLNAIKDRPGIPTRPLEVRFGPYCAGTWQLAIVGIVGETADEEEQLLVVTSGRPTALTVIEAGADVCTDRVEDDAPVGIRVRACGF